MDCYNQNAHLRRCRHHATLPWRRRYSWPAGLAFWGVIPAWLIVKAGEVAVPLELPAEPFLYKTIGWAGRFSGALSGQPILLWRGLCRMTAGWLWLATMIRMRRDCREAGMSKGRMDPTAHPSLICGMVGIVINTELCTSAVSAVSGRSGHDR